jgi:signal transduction histidine kinase
MGMGCSETICRPNGMHMLLCGMVCGMVAWVCLPGWATEPELVAVSEVLMAPSTDWTGRDPVRVRGIVTWVVPGRATITIEDDSAAVWVNCFHDAAFKARWFAMQPDVAIGTEVTVTGFIDPGGYAPHVRATAIEVLNSHNPPPVRPADLGRLFSGIDNARRVAIEGVVQECSDTPARGDWSVTLQCQARTVRLFLPEHLWPTRPRELIDAEVRIVGVAGAERNTRGEFLGPSISVARPEDVIVVTPPRADPFTSPHLQLEALGTFRTEPRSGHRIRTDGVVTFVAPSGFFVIQEGLRGVRVAAAEQAMPAVGDHVEVAGFLDMSRTVAGLSEAEVRFLGRKPVPVPANVSPDEITRINSAAMFYGRMATPTSYEGCLVRFPATVVEITEGDDDSAEIVLSSGASFLSARLQGMASVARSMLEPGTEIDVTGVMQIDLVTGRPPRSPSRDPAIQRLTLLLRSMDDIVVLRRPSWWTPARLGTALAAVLVGLGAAVAWAETLRRRVRRITAQLSSEMQSRRNAAIEFDAALRERNRIAANLHDTLLQTLRGVDFQLGACRAFGEQSAGDPWEHLEVARRMVNHAAEELRGSVWALRTMPMPGESFAASLEAIARQTGHGRAEHIDVRVVGEPFDLPHFVSGNLLLVAQEAMHNALVHADCGQIVVTAEFEPRGGAVDLVIADDGQGFVPGTEAGPSQGHFGLTGMRERIERLGGAFAIESSLGQGTTVQARVQKRDYDSLIDVAEQATAT